MKVYKKRIADELLQRKLEGTGAVLIEGPKWCGKTTTAEQKAQSVAYMDDIGEGAQLQQLAEINPQMVLMGKPPRLIDEWQIVPKLWDAVRFEVDHRGKEGQFILTGSGTSWHGQDNAFWNRQILLADNATDDTVGIR